MIYVFSKPSDGRATIDMQFPRYLDVEQQEDLEREVSNEEIKKAVWDCGTDKSPGPDGFNFVFYRHFWSTIEKDVVEAVSMYKIIAKILSNRLVGVLGDIVSEVQSAFIAERQILDGPFILNEVLQWCKRKKKQSIIFKVDFEKAYDSVRWDFLDEVLKKFGFGKKWCEWIQACLCSSRGSILLNGSPTEEFQFYKGLKQGDPLSPFLFILIMESLHLSFQRVVDMGLFYADDAVFVGQWSEKNIITLVHVLECFFRASGLRINMSKSKILGINVDGVKVKQAAAKLGCLILQCPFSYLGTKVGGSMTRVDAWKEVVDKVKSRLSKWKMKTLSIGGRLTLLKSVLGSIPIFHMSIFRVPTGVLKTLESIRSQFFNGNEVGSKKASWVKWNDVLMDKARGGLGVASLYALNRGLLIKWFWKFYNQKSSLWAKVIKAIHGEDGGMNSSNVSAEDSLYEVGKFTFFADFVVVDYDVDPRVPLILGRPFLRTARALVDVHGEELILRDGDEKLTFKVDSTLKYSHMHRNESINMIDIIDTTCEDHFHEVLQVWKSIHPLSGSPTPSSDPIGDILFLEKILEDEPSEAKKSEINPLIREPSDTLLMGDNKIKFNPLKDINDPVPILRVFEKPLDFFDSI
ncbi:RNA-directed DNA polymerase, eukaryota [Tanacetum coccineum]